MSWGLPRLSEKWTVQKAEGLRRRRARAVSAARWDSRSGTFCSSAFPGWLIKVDDSKLKLKLKLFYSGKNCEARKAEAGRLRAQIPYLRVLLPFIELVCRALPTFYSLLIDRRKFQRDDPITPCFFVGKTMAQERQLSKKVSDGPPPAIS